MVSRRTIAAALVLGLTSLGVITASAQPVPCFDSDGDGWADPEVASDSCPPDNCPGAYNYDQTSCFSVGDPVNDSTINVLDVVRSVDYAFRGLLPNVDSACQSALVGGTDVNCDGVTSIVDVVKLVNVAFRGGVDDFCRPCLCDCYPSSCPELDTVVNLLPNNGSFEQYCHGTLGGWDTTWWSHYVELIPSAAPGAGNWGLAVHPEWGWSATIRAETPDSIPGGGIYRLSAYASWDGSGLCCGTDVRFSLRHGTHWKELFEWGEEGWTYFELVDSLPAGEIAPLKVELYGSFGQWGNIVRYDRVTLEYLGQP